MRLLETLLPLSLLRPLPASPAVDSSVADEESSKALLGRRGGILSSSSEDSSDDVMWPGRSISSGIELLVESSLLRESMRFVFEEMKPFSPVACRLTLAVIFRLFLRPLLPPNPISMFIMANGDGLIGELGLHWITRPLVSPPRLVDMTCVMKSRISLGRPISDMCSICSRRRDSCRRPRSIVSCSSNAVCARLSDFCLSVNSGKSFAFGRGLVSSSAAMDVVSALGLWPTKPPKFIKSSLQTT
mmetsp:Transcript_35354/g.85558  ORF Transcript_35354/g.85558 Transcript_35354/m.85558 type:complete len:244 (-) Transcript_35354:2836-3567(-)